MAKSVKIIPATINLHTHLPKAQTVLRRVAAYARVSTDSEEQYTSYVAQVSYYTDYIKRNTEWEFVDVYTEMLTTSLIQMHPTCTQIAP